MKQLTKKTTARIIELYAQGEKPARIAERIMLPLPQVYLTLLADKIQTYNTSVSIDKAQ